MAARASKERTSNVLRLPAARSAAKSRSRNGFMAASIPARTSAGPLASRWCRPSSVAKRSRRRAAWMRRRVASGSGSAAALVRSHWVRSSPSDERPAVSRSACSAVGSASAAPAMAAVWAGDSSPRRAASVVSGRSRRRRAVARPSQPWWPWSPSRWPAIRRGRGRRLVSRPQRRPVRRGRSCTVPAAWAIAVHSCRSSTATSGAIVSGSTRRAARHTRVRSWWAVRHCRVPSAGRPSASNTCSPYTRSDKLFESADVDHLLDAVADVRRRAEAA